MKITCYGPRGSIPSPSRKGRNGQPDFNTMEFGGNTSSYLIEAGPFTVLMDMGSGIAVLGDDLMKTGRGVGKQFIVPISHWHWDHIQGGPFAIPFFVGSNQFHYHGFAPVGSERTMSFKQSLEEVLADQQDAPHFPISHNAMPGQKEYRPHHFQSSETVTYFCNEAGEYVYNATQMVGHVHETLPADIRNDPRRWLKITTIPLNHPNGCLGYRIEYMGDVAVYCSDNEPLLYLNKEIIKHAKDCDWLLLDGQYTAEQLAGMSQTFGHGTPRNCVEQAKATNAKRCVIHHHDPRHDDTKLAAMEADAIAYAKEIGYTGIVEFAREGQVWELGSL